MIILVYDALTSLNMSLYGYERQTTPQIERFARQAVVYHAHYATATFTTPGTASILTGTYPWTHRAFHLHGTLLKELENNHLFNILGDGVYRLGYSHNLLVTTLLHQMSADLDRFMFTRDMALQDLQYSDSLFPRDYNASFWGEKAILRSTDTRPSSLFLSHLYRMWENFREYQLNGEWSEAYPQGISENNGVFYVLEDGIDWCLKNLKGLPQPFVVYLHFLPPHHPYLPRKEFINRFQDGYVPIEKPRPRLSQKFHSQEFLNERRQAYDEYLAFADSEFGRLYDYLLNNRVLDNTCLAFTSDHGEMFERGIWGHDTRSLYEPVIRVPMIISKPGQTSREDIYQRTSSVDLVPTLLKSLNIAAPDWLEGQILPGFSEAVAAPEQDIYAMEVKKNPARGKLTNGSFALIRGKYKLVHYLDKKLDITELYDLENDPEELDDRSKTDRKIAKSLRTDLDTKVNQVNQKFDQ